MADEAIFSNYDSWKGWQATFSPSTNEAAYYALELRGLVLIDCTVFEIGFGTGAFLGWAESQGARIMGSEVTPALARSGAARGLEMVPADFEACAALAPESLDLVAAFDVFEHLTTEVIAAKLRAVGEALKPGGHLILRYPNGQSPFGLAAQHGDVTHITALSRARIDQLAAGTSLETLRYGGVARPKARRLQTRLVRALRYMVRDMHMRVLNFVYGTDVNLEPVVTQLLVKRIGTPDGVVG
ncbi:MAG: methyltransferase domain-containing protein [Sphingomonas sp.]